MNHAARQWDDAPSDHLAACISLKRGSSARATCILEDVPGGTTMSIGADPGCDWQIRAACVPPHAVSVLLLSGNLFVRSTCEGEVLLDGKPLGDEWVAVRHGARFDIGLAQLEVARGAEPSAFDRSLAELSYSSEDYPAQVATMPQRGLSTATRLEYPAWSDAAANALTRPEARASAANMQEEQAEERPSLLGMRPSRGFAPSLLGDDHHSASGLWMYVVAGLATVFAYAGWVVALDQF